MYQDRAYIGEAVKRKGSARHEALVYQEEREYIGKAVKEKRISVLRGAHVPGP